MSTHFGARSRSSLPARRVVEVHRRPDVVVRDRPRGRRQCHRLPREPPDAREREKHEPALLRAPLEQRLLAAAQRGLLVLHVQLRVRSRDRQRVRAIGIVLAEDPLAHRMRSRPERTAEQRDRMAGPRPPEHREQHRLAHATGAVHDGEHPRLGIVAAHR
jgi:hypothetical protein